ncbi:MAG: hypothetical protein ABUK20_02810 [Anaerolineales bacterium]
MIQKSSRRSTILAWVLCAICVLAAVAQLIFWVGQLASPPSLFDIVEAFGWGLAIPVVFSILAALIIARQPGNRVGWLMMLIALATVSPIPNILASLPAPPTMITPGLWVLLWLDNWSWIPVIFPIFLIPLHFPTGRPPSSRWNWVNWLAIGMWLFFIFFASFLDTIGPLSEAWSLPNPLGFNPIESALDPFMVIWSLGLVTLALAGVASLFVRYRGAQIDEREQIKWLLYAGAMFGVFYTLTVIALGDFNSNGWVDLLFVLSILTIPAAVTIAILRYHLYDIDIIIRRTLVYGALTLLLVVVYFGSVVLLQQAFRALTGQDSPLAVVISTLIIAALFNPLRVRVQEAIDRRFYRNKYDAQQALADFAATARDEVDLERLQVELVSLVQETMQPEQVSVVLIKNKIPSEEI